MQTEQLLSWSGMTDTERSTTSSSNEEEEFRLNRIFRKCYDLSAVLLVLLLLFSNEPLCSVSVIPLQHRMILFARILSGWSKMTGRLLGRPKDTATRNRIGSRTKVSQPFDY